MCLKEPCFPDCWKVSRWSLYFRMLRKGLQLKTTALLVFFLWLVKSLKSDHLEKCGLFSDFQYGKSSRSTADLLTLVSDRISRAFNRSGATRTVPLGISKAFDRVWHAGLLHKLKSCGISGEIFGLTSSFLSNRCLRVVLDGKSSQECPVNAGDPQGSILVPTLCVLYINDLPGDVICNIATFSDYTTLYSAFDQVFDLWQQLELAFLNTNLICETQWTDAGSGLLISMPEKLNWFRLTGLITLVLLIWKWMGLF